MFNQVGSELEVEDDGVEFYSDYLRGSSTLPS